MIAPLNHIVVRVDNRQNEEFNIHGNIFKTAKRYNENFRERNPVIANVIEGYGEITKGSWIVCNYNYFDEDSPLQVFDNIFSIPVNEEIFAIIKEDGSLKSLMGNVLVERVIKPSSLTLPPELIKKQINQGIVISNSEGWYKGQYILWLPFSDYEIVYLWNGEEKRAIKIHKSEIVGYLKN